MSTVLRRLACVLLAIGLSLLTVAGVTAAGVSVSMPESGSPRAAPPQGWPVAASARAGRIRVAVVVGGSGSVISDALAPYEVFASSPSFFVYTVSAVRAPVPMVGGPDLLPDHTLAEVETSVALAPDVVVVPAVSDPTGPVEAPLRGWISRQADRGAHILGVCSGSQLLAASGLLDARRAASHWAAIQALEPSYPLVSWVRGQRYVQDGPITTTAGVTSGVPAALRLVEQLAGAAEAQRVGKVVAYPGWSLNAPTSIPAKEPSPSDLPMALSFAFPWLRPTVGVGLVEGVGEIDAAAAFEVYNMSAAARVVPISAHPTITTRHGVVLLPTLADEAAPRLDRLVVPGARSATTVAPALLRWAAARNLDVEALHGGRPAGELGFDAALRDLAGHSDRATALAAAQYIEYPFAHLQLAGDPWPWRPTALLALTLAVAVGVGLLPTAARQASRRRSAFSQEQTAGANASDANYPLVKV